MHVAQGSWREEVLGWERNCICVRVWVNTNPETDMKVIKKTYLIPSANLFDKLASIRAVLRIWIRDPVPFCPLDPGSKIRVGVKNQDSYSYFREIRKNFWG